jgi:hypothetical protein
MGTVKDGIDLGIEALQFWRRFKGRRVRVWPSELTIRICSESGKKWVTSAEEREPYWWEESRPYLLSIHPFPREIYGIPKCSAERPSFERLDQI